jgi:hypothetical protein
MTEGKSVEKNKPRKNPPTKNWRTGCPALGGSKISTEKPSRRLEEEIV